MFKHANTWAPEDRVRAKKPLEGKEASAQGAGSVQSSDGQTVAVAWDDGSFSRHEVAELDPA